MNKNQIIPIILSGGSGSRLWPLSRESYPKQYQILNAKSKKSLIQITQERIAEISNISSPIIICNEEHRFIVAEQMRKINVTPLSILLEPASRNTAPAVAIAAMKALEFHNDPILLFLSADHKIEDETKFTNIIEEAIESADQGRLVTFGVPPTHPETGYGYIESTKPFKTNFIEGIDIKRFIEKPTIEKAKELINDKRFTWNSGIFLFKSKTILNEIEKFSPTIISSCEKALEKELYDLNFQRLDKEEFESCPNISIDIAVMEKTKLGIVFPLNVGWSDIGSWESLWNSEPKDKEGNVIEGKVILNETKNSYIRSESKLIVGLGLQEVVIVETNDAVLVTNKKYSQDVKNIVSNLNKEGFPEAKVHKKIHRPWGHFISIDEGPMWQIKKIIVNPNSSLSLQMHHHRSEHWVVVKGTACVEIDSKKTILKKNQSINIPLGAKHRLSNPDKNQLIIIEVQSGSYLGEDDIIRFEDNYGRKN